MLTAPAAAAAIPGVDGLQFLSETRPAALTPAELVDAVIVSERLLAHVNGIQTRLLAELGRPQRCGDVTKLVAALVEKAGMGRGSDGRVDPDEVAELTADRSIGVASAELAALLDWSPNTARIRIKQSMRMVSALPRTAVALERGLVDVGRARMMVERTDVLSPELCGAVERRILPLVKGRSKGRLETLVDREVIHADPDAAENRRIKAVTDRCVIHRPDKDGMGVINALLPAEAAVMVFTVIDLVAAANKGLDGRTVDQRRADAIADIADELLTFGFVDLEGLVARAERPESSVPSVDQPGSSAAPTDKPAPSAASPVEPDAASASVGRPAPSAAPPAEPDTASASVGRPEPSAPLPDVTGSTSTAPVKQVHPTPAGDPADKAERLSRAMSRHGRRPHLSVTGAWTTLAGLDDLPAHLDGHGTITGPLFRAIAQSWGTLTAVGVDPATGTATAIGALTYRTKQRISDQVIILAGTCRAAGCRMPASKCDLDHVEPFDHRDPAGGGATTLVNHLPECRFHHLLKHHTNWTPHLQADMSVVWTTNTGHTAVSHPREFTMPGEWLRPAGADSSERSDPSDADGTEPCHDRLKRSESERGLADGNQGSPTFHHPTTHRPIIVGPTVSGPTIPVVPAGADFTEPNTELETLESIPHPGSVEIFNYRVWRTHARELSRRRLRRVAQRMNSSHEQSPAQAEREALDKSYRAASLRADLLRTEGEARDTKEAPQRLFRLRLSEPEHVVLPDEPPF